MTYAPLARDLQPGDRVLLADGAAELRVASTSDDVVTEVVRGGIVRSRAGVSVPSERLSAPPLTDKDRADAPRAVGLGVDYVAQSFVRRADDIRTLRALLGEAPPPIVAKIETRPAVDDFDAILDVVDAVMIARGDLGVELPYEEVPIIQKQLVRRALDRGIPTIVATQMLESMVEAPRPTRAEASDVANAVFDGADAIMLSAETAIGKFPILAAEAAIRIARLCEEKGAAHLAPGARDLPGHGCWGADPCRRRTGPCGGRRRWHRVLHADWLDRAHAGGAAAAGSGASPSRRTRGSSPSWRSCTVCGRGHVPMPTSARAASPARTPAVRIRGVAGGAAVVLVASTAQPDTGPNAIEMYRRAAGTTA